MTVAKEISQLRKKQKRREFLMAVPLILFTVLFIVGPMVYMVALSFMTRADTWGVVPEFTLKNYGDIGQPVYLRTFGESLKLAVISTVLIIARDLGASPMKAFLTVSLKLTLPGLLSGVVLTFVPSMGLFFIADLLGGNKVVLVGNLIQTQLMNAHNWPFAAALSVVLLVLTTVIIWLYRKLSGVKDLEGIV